jgi:NADPH:quinone reductase-like Zn-dependent oxidoreductase
MLGVEAAGEVVDMGSEVTEVRPGEQVPFAPEGRGLNR